MRLHMLGLPHTRTRNECSHCAYTGKVRRWAPMLAPLGYECIHYGVGEPDSSGWSAHVEIMTPAEQRDFLGYDPLEGPPKGFVGDVADVSSPLYREFNARLLDILRSIKWTTDDILCLPFGHGHQAGVPVRVMANHAVETGIGYPTCITGWRIYESYAWFHWHLGVEHRHAWPSEWVVPNYYDVEEWPARDYEYRGDYVLYMGRITWVKGLNIVWNLARARRDLMFVVCGQGDPSPWMTEPNIIYHPPVKGIERAELINKSMCVLVPSVMLEPFGGVAVEAMLTGTPVLTSTYGAFSETVPDELRCNVFGDWLAGLDVVQTADSSYRRALRERAIRRYSLQAVGLMYDKIFKRIPEMRSRGWAAGGPELI